MTLNSFSLSFLFALCLWRSTPSFVKSNKASPLLNDPQFDLNAVCEEECSGEIVTLIEFNTYYRDYHVGCHEDRNELKQIHKNRNIALFNEIGLSDYSSYYLSEFSPFAEVKYKNLSIFSAKDKKKLDNCCKSGRFSYEYYPVKNDIETALIKPENKSYYPFERALGDVGISYCENDSSRIKGSGVKIGVLENGLPTDYTNFNNTIYTTFGNTTNSHCQKVASILGGSYGIAPESSLYFVAKSDYSSQLQCIDLMINNGVNVINHSGGFAGNPHGYNIYARYIDYLVRTTGCMFVNAGGNDDDFFPNPSYGLNIICVGSNNRSLKPSLFNNYKIDPEGEYDAIIKKPNLFAPGENLFGIRNICDGENDSDCLSGTSYSAPIVSGIIALLMSEFSSLKTNPGRLLSILTSSCVKMNGQVNDYDNKHGFGIINYERARIAYYDSASLTTQNLSSTLFQSSFSMGPESTVIISSSSLYKSNNVIQNVPDLIDPNDIKYVITEIKIFDSNNTLLAQSNCFGNISYCTYKNENTSYQLVRYEICALNYGLFQNDSQTISYSLFVDQSQPVSVLSVTDNYLDTTPSFTWSISPSSSVNQLNIFFTNYRGQQIGMALNIPNNATITIPELLWSAIIDMRGREYYVYARVFTTDSNHYCTQIESLLEPNRYDNHTQLLPVDYNFEEQYFFYEKTTNLITTDIAITTKRLRCGYIQNQYVVLSTRRSGAGNAYLELTFDKSVYAIMIGFAWWGSNEYIYPQLGDSYIVETLDQNGVWSEWIDLMNDVSITTDRNNVDRFQISNSNGFKGVRIVGHCANPTGNMNRGRLCVDDIVLSTNSSSSFLSQFYDPVF